MQCSSQYFKKLSQNLKICKWFVPFSFSVKDFITILLKCLSDVLLFSFISSETENSIKG